jgi:hypothetical protein
MTKLVDRYTLGARVLPIVVVALPLLLAISAWIPFGQWPLKLAAGGVLVSLVAFVLSQIARDAGKNIEQPLWDVWGGPPTVRMLRHSDETFGSGTKAKVHRRLVELQVVKRIPTREEEQKGSESADAVYRICSDWLRNKALQLKAHTPFDVIHHENISYGYRRNLLGIRTAGLVIVAVALTIIASAFLYGRQPFIELAVVAVMLAHLVFAVTQASLKRSADNYSERLLNAVEAIPPQRAKRKPTSKLIVRPSHGPETKVTEG